MTSIFCICSDGHCCSQALAETKKSLQTAESDLALARFDASLLAQQLKLAFAAKTDAQVLA
jgi:hypothetical protein